MSDVHAFVAVLKSEVASALTTGLVAVEGRDYLSTYETERAAAAYFRHYNPDVSADDVAVLQVTLPPSCVIEGCGGHPFCFMTSYLPPENLRAIAQTTPKEEPSFLTTSPPPRKRLRSVGSGDVAELMHEHAELCAKIMQRDEEVAKLKKENLLLRKRLSAGEDVLPEFEDENEQQAVALPPPQAVDDDATKGAPQTPAPPKAPAATTATEDELAHLNCSAVASASAADSATADSLADEEALDGWTCHPCPLCGGGCTGHRMFPGDAYCTCAAQHEWDSPLRPLPKPLLAAP